MIHMLYPIDFLYEYEAHLAIHRQVMCEKYLVFFLLKLYMGVIFAQIISMGLKIYCKILNSNYFEAF